MMKGNFVLVKAESFFQLLKFHDQERFLYQLAETLNSNSLNEVELALEPIERTMIVLDLTDWLRVTEASIRLSADTDCQPKVSKKSWTKNYEFCLLSWCEKILIGKRHR
jgi:hypothetical protein